MSDLYYTCNGSPNGCERVRFNHCTFHDNLDKGEAMALVRFCACGNKVSKFSTVHVCDHCKHNPNCDGGHCQSATGEVRTLATGGGGNAILCRDCFNYEMQWRVDRNGELRYSTHFPIVTWDSLAVYPEA